jgi:hypothetical protein
MGESKGGDRILLWKLEEKGPFERPRHRWEANIK